MVIFNKQEIKYILNLLKQILKEPRLSTEDLHGSGIPLREMYTKLYDSVNINIPTVIKVLEKKIDGKV